MENVGYGVYASEDEDEADLTFGGGGEEEKTRRAGVDLSVVLSGKSSEFWRGLWAGWNGAGSSVGTGMGSGGGVGGEGAGEVERGRG